MTARPLLLLALALCGACGSDAPTGTPAAAAGSRPVTRLRLVLTHATVHTLLPGVATATTLGIDQDRIVAVSDGPLPGDQVVDLAGAHVYPGLTDAHGHLAGLGLKLVEVDLVGARSYQEVIERVVARAQETPAGEWVVGRGWDQNRWPEGQREFPDHRALSAAVPQHPVWLTRVDGHAALANRMAMDLAGLKPDQADPAGGRIQRTVDGQPTGVFVDKAMALVGAALPDVSVAELRRRYLAAQQACLSAGLTSVHDAGESPAEIAELAALEAEGQLQLRVYGMLSAQHRDAIRKGPWRSPGGRVVVRAVKGYADGALGSRGAALLAPYLR